MDIIFTFLSKYILKEQKNIFKIYTCNLKKLVLEYFKKNYKNNQSYKMFNYLYLSAEVFLFGKDLISLPRLRAHAHIHIKKKIPARGI